MPAIAVYGEHSRIERHDDDACHRSLPVAPCPQGIGKRILEYMKDASRLYPRRMSIDSEREIVRRRMRRRCAQKEGD